ncbi:senescence-specific cysteine protease SAG39-like [Salvia divinorum]|uniref:Senescence-specific cysteine protease SAG39-like n=1 Tax=Salvia divinorum TaxID=28513 RepID=A0ABD1FK18_SALDI
MSIKHEEWMAEHGFSYENEEVKQTRSNDEEFLAKYARSFMPLLKMPSSNQSSFKYKDMKDIPPNLDWRDHNAVTPVKSQGGCGVCWAFAPVAAIEGIIAIRSCKLTQLSEQHILDCNYEHSGCKGGRMDLAFAFVVKNGGLACAADYPYTATHGVCADNIPSSLSPKIIGLVYIPKNNEAALLEAVANQPVSVNIDASVFQFYRSGVYTGECETNINHSVAIVGYGESEDGVKYWLIKNSWGREFGDDGYFKLRRDVGTKEGMCGIAMFGCYATVDSSTFS